MNLRERAGVLAFHRSRLQGSPLDALGWRGPMSQIRRFEALCRWGDFNGLSILDLGCGFGDLKPFLDRRFAGITYLGVDFLPEFIASAQATYGHLPNTRFVQADFLSATLPTVDVVLASGCFNYACSDSEHPWGFVDRMWSVARQGVAFNLLDGHRIGSDGLLQGHDSQDSLERCREWDPRAELLNDYLPDDFTLLMHKPCGKEG